MSFMTARKKNKISEFFKSIRKPNYLPMIDKMDRKMTTLVSQLKSQNPMERKKAESELRRNSDVSKPYLENMLSEPSLDLQTRVTAMRILGGMGGLGQVLVPSLPVNLAEQPIKDGVRVDPKIVDELRESYRRTKDPKIRKSISDTLQRLGYYGPI